MRLAIFGAGLVGQRAAARAVARNIDDVLLVGMDREPPVLAGVSSLTGWSAGLTADYDTAVLAGTAADQPRMAALLLRRGVNVIATADAPRAVEGLLALGGLARARHATLVVGSAYAPGLSSLIAAWLVDRFDDVFEVGTSSFGTGGPACARRHHRSMAASALEVRNGQLGRVRGGSGRALVFFPEPVGGADCFRAGLVEPWLLHRAFPLINKIHTRQAATRRDRLTARLPMMRPPHAEGLIGALSVEVRGRIGDRVEHRSIGATGPQATGAALTAISMVEMVRDGAFDREDALVFSPAMVRTPAIALAGLADSITLWTYDGSTSAPPAGAPIQAAKKWNVGRIASSGDSLNLQKGVFG